MDCKLQRITSVTTKVRRLGYFVLFSRILRNRPYSPFSLQNQIINDENKNRKFLEDACKELPIIRNRREYVTGEISSKGKSKGKDAFNRYLNTAKEFGFVQEMAGRLYNTKQGEVLSALNEKSINPFKLSIAQKYWLLRVILDKDYDYSRAALLCSIVDGPDEDSRFINMVKQLWQQKLTTGTIGNPEVYDAIKKAINTKWDSPKEYYTENIKAPRIEWFMDLGAIDFWNIPQNRLTARDSLKLLLDSEEKKFSSLFILHMKPFLKGSVTYWNEISKTGKMEWMERFVTQCFDLFTSETLPRISVNQVIEYGLSNLAESGIICESDVFENWLARFTEQKGEKYRFVRTVSEVDRGYISKV